jgi:plasmid stabilization system protein ParE
VFDDFDRFLDHFRQHEVADASARIADILEALGVLARHPLIGRPVGDGKRELVIGHDARGYVALYRFVAAIDTAFVLAIRGRREAGFTRG